MPTAFSKNSTRNYGVDALRIISSIMIVMIHVLGQGGILNASRNLSVRGEVMWVLQIGCLCFVNVFALISGYVGFGSKHKLSGILNLWLQVFMYGIISTVLILALRKEPFSMSLMLKTLFPIITEENWYFTAYFALFFFMPLLDALVDNVSANKMRICLLASSVLFMIVETVRSVDVFGVSAGYSVIWLALMYVIGAYVKKYDPLSKLKLWHCGVGFLICMLLTFAARIIIEIATLKLLGEASHGTKFITYTSPIMVLQALFALQAFCMIKIPKVTEGIIKFFTPMTFGVFIIHTTTMAYRYGLHNAFSFVQSYPLIGVLGISIGATLAIWLVCSLLDYVRILIFKLLGIFKLTNWIGYTTEDLLGKL